MENSIEIKAEEINFYYGTKQALKNINLEIYEKQVTALIGPSGCGKSTFIRLLNRMNDLIPHTRVEGKIYFEGQNIFEENVDVVSLRRRVGMVFQKPNPFPKDDFRECELRTGSQGDKGQTNN